MKKVKILKSECPENLEVDVNQWLNILLKENTNNKQRSNNENKD